MPPLPYRLDTPSAPAPAVPVHWARCVDTQAAPPDYYAVQEHVLRHAALPLVGRANRALDVGCGDGWFTCVIAEHSRAVTGLDLSPQYIAQARQLALERGLRHVQFAVHDAALPFPVEPADLVSCMGLLSTLLDDTAFLRLAVQLVTHTRPGGHLITKDAVSQGAAELDTMRGTPRIYRNANRYVATFMALGLELVGEFHLAKGSDKRFNGLWVWRHTGD